MNLVQYSDSDDDSDDNDKIDDSLEEIIEIQQKPVIDHQFNFGSKRSGSGRGISLDFGTKSTTKSSLFDSLPVPASSSLPNKSLHQKSKSKSKKKKKKKKKSKTNDTSNPKKRKLPSNPSTKSLIDILPEPMHKKQKLSSSHSPNHKQPIISETALPSTTTSTPNPTSSTSSDPVVVTESNKAPPPNPSSSTLIPDDIPTFDVRKKQAEVHRVHLNPMATFSISNDSNDQRTENESVSNDHSNGHTQSVTAHTRSATNYSNAVRTPKPYVVPQQTAASMYKVDDDNEFITRHQLPDAPELQRVLKPDPSTTTDSNASKQRNTLMDDKDERIKALRAERLKEKEASDDVITISQSDHLLNDQESWRRTFEIDDITRDEIKIVPTKSYNRETGQMEQVAKYTKTQRRKHQINTLAYEAQEKALQLAMRRSAAYKTKAETQAKYGW